MGGKEETMTHAKIFPTFTIKDLAKAKPLLDKCVEDTRTEAGCLYYGWTIKEDGSKLFCRETYVDGAAAGHHLSCVAKSGALGEALEKGYIALDNIGAAVGEMLDSGAASLDKIEFHGPKEGWPTFKKTADGFGGIYWDRYASFSKFKM